MTIYSLSINISIRTWYFSQIPYMTVICMFHFCWQTKFLGFLFSFPSRNRTIFIEFCNRWLILANYDWFYISQKIKILIVINLKILILLTPYSFFTFYKDFLVSFGTFKRVQQFWQTKLQNPRTLIILTLSIQNFCLLYKIMLHKFKLHISLILLAGDYS